MSDLDRFIELLNDFGVEYRYTINDNRSIEVELNAKSTKVGGYIGFSTIFSFDKDGKFLIVGIWA